MTRNLIIRMAALTLLLAGTTACTEEKRNVDMTPIPVTAEPPYICDYIPLRAVELMTAVNDPLVKGGFDLDRADIGGHGSCAVRHRGGDRLTVLYVSLSPGAGNIAEVEEKVEEGATPLPEIVPGGKGYYFKEPATETDNTNTVWSMLVQGEARLMIQLLMGAEGRDNMADVLALMKLIAPKLITEASTRPATPAPAAKG